MRSVRECGWARSIRGAIVSAVLTLSVVGAGGPFAMASAAGLTWGSPISVDPNRGFPFSVSCASASFCVTVDGDGNWLSWDGSSWSANGNIDPNGFISVSCPKISFCTAVGPLGDALTWDGSRWSAPLNVDSSEFLTSVSCPKVSFCAAVDYAGNALTWSGGQWSVPLSIDPGHALNSVSCPNASYCVAVDYVGRVLTWEAGHWSRPTRIDKRHSLNSVSCPNASFCIAVDDSGRALEWKSGHWSPRYRSTAGRASNRSRAQPPRPVRLSMTWGGRLPGRGLRGRPRRSSTRAVISGRSLVRARRSARRSMAPEMP